MSRDATRGGWGRPPAPRLGGQDGGDGHHSGQCFDGLFGGLPQWIETRPALRFDLDGKADIAVADDDPRYHPERDDIPALVGIAHRRQRVENLFLSNRHS